jgi:hypothetical protein
MVSFDPRGLIRVMRHALRLRRRFLSEAAFHLGRDFAARGVRWRPSHCRAGVMGRHLTVFWGGVLCLSLLGIPTSRFTEAAEADPAWLTGAARQQAVGNLSGLTWSETGLRWGLSNLARRQRVAIWLDRRLDPDQVYSLTLPEMPFGRLLQRIAAEAGADVAWLGDVAYVGPPEVPARLVTTAMIRQQELAALPVSMRERFTGVRPIAWPDLTTPRELVAQAAREARVRVLGGEFLPHDLWAAASLPPLPWSDRLSIVLAGFNLTYELAPDGTTIRLVALPEHPVIGRTLTVPASAEEQIDDLAKQFPGVHWQRQGRRVTLTGRLDQVEAIASRLQGDGGPNPARATEPARTAERRYTLEVKRVSAAAILAELARRDALELKSTPQVDQALRQTVSLRVNEVTLQELLDKALQPVGVRYVLTGKRLELFLAP